MKERHKEKIRILEMDDVQWTIVLIPLIHFARRMLLAISLVLANDRILTQIILQMAISTVSIIVQSWYKPFDSQKSNRLELFTESVILGTLSCLMLFTDGETNPETRYKYGYIFIALMILYTAVHMSVLLHAVIVSVKRRVRRWLILRRTRSRQDSRDAAA